MNLHVYTPQEGGSNIPVYTPSQDGGSIPVYIPARPRGGIQRGGGLGIGRRFQTVMNNIHPVMDKVRDVAVHSTANIAKGVIRDALEGKDLKELLRDQTTNAAMDLKHHAEKQAGKILGVKRGMSQESNICMRLSWQHVGFKLCILLVDFTFYGAS